MNYDEAIQWLSDEAAYLIRRANVFNGLGMESSEREMRECAASLITIENMLRYHARVCRH